MDNRNFLSDLLNPTVCNSGQTNRDAFFKLAAKKFGRDHADIAIEKEAARLRELARDIKALKNANLI